MWFSVSGHENLGVTEPHEPIPGLFISSATPTRDRDKLTTAGITHILTAARSITPKFKGDYKYMLLDVDDWVQEDLLYYFDKSIKFIDDARKEGGKVLVHCMAGISRSATIVIAYIMYDRKVPFKVAFDMVKQVRPFIQPNPSFKRQLEVYERWVLGVQHPPIHHYGVKYITTPPNGAPLDPSNTAGDVVQTTREPQAHAHAQADATPSGADPASEERWVTSECEILYRLEWLTREDVCKYHTTIRVYALLNALTQYAVGAKKVGAGADPYGVLKQDVYDRYSRAPDRAQPVYLPLRSGEESNDEKEVPEPKFTPMEMARVALGSLRTFTTEDKTVGDELYENVDETKVPERPRISHSTKVWTCVHCHRYLFTPLNVLHLARHHIEIELMEWMTDLGEVTGQIGCPKCTQVIGDYNWQPVKLDDGGYVPVFRIHRKDLALTQVLFDLAVIN